MSKYTTELRFICETLAGGTESVGYDDTNAIIETARPLIFNFNYPIFDNNYKSVLETKIIKHFYTREIGAETYGLFHLWLDTKMNEIMPYYNKLYETTLLSFNPLYDIDVYTDASTEGQKKGTESGTSSTTGHEEGQTSSTFEEHNLRNNTTEEYTDGTGEYSGSGTRKLDTTDDKTGSKTETNSGNDTTGIEKADKNTRYDLYSDTPQGALNGVDSETYLTNARKIIDDGTGTTSDSTTTYGKITTTTTTDNSAGHAEETASHKDTKTEHEGKNRTDEESISITRTDVTNTSKDNQIDGSTAKNSKIDSTEQYLKHVYGKMHGKSYAELIRDYRETFLNIDRMVINELNDLFMNLW